MHKQSKGPYHAINQVSKEGQHARTIEETSAARYEAPHENFQGNKEYLDDAPARGARRGALVRGCRAEGSCLGSLLGGDSGSLEHVCGSINCDEQQE